MHVEATGKPIRYRLRSGREVILRPGVPTELPDQAAHELLTKAAGKVRQVKPCADVAVERAENITPVYWQSGNRILGPAVVSFVAKHQGQFFLCLEQPESFLWIHESLLRSRTAFEEQGNVVCNCCGGSEFWRSESVAVVCRRCHPPVSDFKGGSHAG